ncbi:hypothetical protein DIPPA_23511 [Diplonema papillatum]|nr:hypothetical protein DIPPA_23511 [Diplonema papillatum]
MPAVKLLKCGDVLTEVMLYLRVQDVLSCSRCCTEMRRVTQSEAVSSNVLRYDEEEVDAGGVVSDRVVAKLRCTFRRIDPPVMNRYIFQYLQRRHRAARTAIVSREHTSRGWYHRAPLPESYPASNTCTETLRKRCLVLLKRLVRLAHPGVSDQNLDDATLHYLHTVAPCVPQNRWAAFARSPTPPIHRKRANRYLIGS